MIGSVDTINVERNSTFQDDNDKSKKAYSRSLNIQSIDYVYACEIRLISE